ncbi:DUF7689 domain-containing protein [Sanguibacter massiliensis]|uniref:DUF7689 domain-containing protein n=1 Tax=Sanguibacter massiliensis TaxID=1973217 RepID=UPI00101ADB40|nr:hypothetical protein [Sanguibacter massiliensis]
MGATSATAKSTSTDDLVESVLASDELGLYLAYDSPQKGFEAVRDAVPEVDALLSRRDASSALVEHYQELDLVETSKSDPFSTIRVAFFELLLAQPEVVESVSDAERVALHEEVLDSWALKLSIDGADHYGTTTSAFLGLRSLAAADDAVALDVSQDSVASEFLEEGILESFDTRDSSELLTSIPERLVESLPERMKRTVRLPSGGEGLARSAGREAYFGASGGVLTAGNVAALAKSYGSTKVYTPRGAAVPALRWSGQDFTAAEKSQANSWVKRAYPSVEVIGSATMKYNCHSYAWHKQSTANDVWINLPIVHPYISDGSYVRTAYTKYINTIPNVPNGVRVYYYGGDHSAVKTSSTHFLSKWGQLGLIKHRPTATPYTGVTQLNYFRRA